MLRKKTRDQIIQESIQAVQATETITNMNPGGVARTMLESVADQVADLYETLDLNMAMRYPTTAVGAYLDLLGESFGLSRIQAQPATASADDKAVRFYVNSGRLLDIVTTGYIPVGTTLTSGTTVSYAVTEDAYFDDAATQVYVSVQSQVNGSASNVGPNQLTTHNLGISGLLVNNPKAISSGQVIEEDTAYRYRIVNFFRSIQRGNLQSLRSAMLTLPNVAEARITEYQSGPGTVEIMLVPTTSVFSDSALQRARFLAQSNKSMGISVTVTQPDYVPIKIHVRLSYIPEATAQEQLQIRNDVRRRLIDYIDDIRIGGTLVINEIRQRVMETDDRIFDMRIECLSIDQRPQLLANYPLANTELFILDPDTDEPVRIR